MFSPPMVNTPSRSPRSLATTCLLRVLEQYRAKKSSSFSTTNGCSSWTGRAGVEAVEAAQPAVEQQPVEPVTAVAMAEMVASAEATGAAGMVELKRQEPQVELEPREPHRQQPV